MARPSSYPSELRKRAVRMGAEVRGDYPTESAAINAVMAKLGIGSDLGLGCRGHGRGLSVVRVCGRPMLPYPW